MKGIKNDTKDKSAIRFLLIYVVVSVLTPIIIKYSVFENTVFSLLSCAR